MARSIPLQARLGWTFLAWFIALAIFFPIFWTILTSFKTEAEAISTPSLFDFEWTTENYTEVQSRNPYFLYFMNSVIISLGSTILALIIAIPAAWAMAFSPTKRTRGLLLWMLSTKMMPGVGVLVPIYLLFRDTGLLDTRTGLVIILTLANLPIVVWMLFTYFREIPGEILEASRMDGASLKEEILYVLTPMALPGIASTLLLNVILAWNEAFWTLNLTAAKAAPLTSIYGQLLQSGRVVLCQAQCCIDDGNRAGPYTWLVQPEATRSWPDIRSGQVIKSRLLPLHDTYTGLTSWDVSF